MLLKYNATFGFCVLVAYKSLQSNLLLMKSQAVVKIKLHVDELGSQQLLNSLEI